MRLGPYPRVTSRPGPLLAGQGRGTRYDRFSRERLGTKQGMVTLHQGVEGVDAHVMRRAHLRLPNASRYAGLTMRNRRGTD